MGKKLEDLVPDDIDPRTLGNLRTNRQRKFDTEEAKKKLRDSKWYKDLPETSGKSYQERTKNERRSKNIEEEYPSKPFEDQKFGKKVKLPDEAPRPSPKPKYRDGGGLYTAQVTPGKWTTKSK